MTGATGSVTPRRSRANRLVALLLVALALALLVVPLPRFDRSTTALTNLLHAPMFLGLTLLMHRIARPRLPGHRVPAALVAMLLSAGVGAASEWGQAFFGRESSWTDLRANLLGSAAGAVLLAVPVRPWPWRFGAGVVALILCGVAGRVPLMILTDNYVRRNELPRLASFETTRETTRWRWQSARVGRGRGGAADGEWALHAVLLPARYPGVSFTEPWPDWSGHSALEFVVCSDRPLDLVVKIFDDEHADRGFPGDDRFETVVRLEGDCRRVSIPLAAIRAAPAEREMDLEHVSGIEFFVVDLEEPARLVLDDVRLR